RHPHPISQTDVAVRTFSMRRTNRPSPAERCICRATRWHAAFLLPWVLCAPTGCSNDVLPTPSVQGFLDIASLGSYRGRSSVRNLTSGEKRSYLAKSVKGTKRICVISGEQGLVCPEFRLCRNFAKPS